MNENEFNEINRFRFSPTAIDLSDLANKTPRTLLYGSAYNNSSNTLHIYLGHDGLLHSLVYDIYGMRVRHDSGVRLDASYCQSRSIVPAVSDFAFCKLLQEKGVGISLSPYMAVDFKSQYYGKIHEQLTDLDAALLDFSGLKLSLQDDFFFSKDIMHLDGVGDLELSLNKVIQGQAKGYFRAIVFLKEGAADAQKWLNNIPRAVEFAVNHWTLEQAPSEYREGIIPPGFTLSPAVAHGLMEITRTFSESRIQQVCNQDQDDQDSNPERSRLRLV